MSFSCMGGKAGRHTLKEATCQGIYLSSTVKVRRQGLFIA